MEDTIKASPKLLALYNWKHIKEVNNRLDAGESPNAVCLFINKNGFKISVPMIYEYARLRRKALVDGITIEHLIGVSNTPLIDKNDPVTKTNSEKLKSEIDGLDMIIQGGYRTLIEWQDKPVSPKTMMDAIRLKNDLTGGNHGFLTNCGIEQLKELESAKYQLIIEHLVSYIPEDKREEAINQIEVIEDGYYQTTPYYGEYLKAKGLSESEIAIRLQEIQARDMADESPETE